jgi:L-threonylcarbamoyladenylate synthase
MNEIEDAMACLRTALGGQVGRMLDGGPCRWGLEFTIVSLLNAQARLLRPGALPLAALRH